MAPLPAVSEVQVEAALFPPTVKPPGSSNTLFLGGAGVRGVVIDGNFIKVTAIGVYLEAAAVPLLAEKWKGKTADELEGSLEFFGDIVTGPYEKFMRVTLLVPLTGPMYSNKVSEGCVAIWKAAGIYTDAEADAVEKFKATFKEESFSPGNSILFTQSPLGTLTIGFSEDGSVPEAGKAVIANKPISETVLDTIIGEHAVSPAAKKSLAARVSQLLGELDNVQPEETPEEVEKKQDQPEEVQKEIK